MSYLVIDVGNTQILTGIFDSQGKLKARWRMNTHPVRSSDEWALLIRQWFDWYQINLEDVTQTLAASVVPTWNESLNQANLLLWQRPVEFLNHQRAKPLNVSYQSPWQVGADRLANAWGAIGLWGPGSYIIVDLGTATTFCAIQGWSYLGGVILPGLHTSLDGLIQKAAALSSVAIEPVKNVLQDHTPGAIQAGVFWGHVGAMREIIQRLQNEVFTPHKATVIATGGLSHLFMDLGLFDKHEPDLVLWGLKFWWEGRQHVAHVSSS